MRAACARLEAVPLVRDVYTDRHLAGLGKNYLTEANRQKALGAYRSYTRLYALLGLAEQALAAARERHWRTVERLLEAATEDPHWEHQRRLLGQELGVRDVAAGLGELPDLLEQMAGDVERSKARDDFRGPRVIEDYAAIQVRAGDDPFVQHTWSECRRVQEEVRHLQARLEGQPVSGGRVVLVLANGSVPTAESA
jgi:hypothetical protein